MIAPLGAQHVTGPGPFGIAISPSGRAVVSANSGPAHFSLTVIEKQRDNTRTVRHLVPQGQKGDENDWRGVSIGIAFSGERNVFVSEGSSGKIRLVDIGDGNKKREFSLNQNGVTGSFSGDLAFDSTRELLHVLDQANSRLVTFDTKQNKLVSSLPVGRVPFAIALSPDQKKAYITSVRESGSVGVVDITNAAAPKIEASIRTGVPFGDKSHGGSSPSGIVATPDRVFVSNAHNDSITVIDAKSNTVTAEIQLRVPGLENYRGVIPIGLAYHEATGWLLATMAGANALVVIDTKQMRVIADIPVAWIPTRMLIDRDTVYVANAKGHGAGPNAVKITGESFGADVRRGSISVFPIPAQTELRDLTGRVFAANGWRPKPVAEGAEPLPSAIRHVVLIVKEGRTFDEVLGDVRQAGNGPVAAIPALARFGREGYADGKNIRLSLQRVNVTPNHHKLAGLYSFNDNFYADSETSVDGLRWLAGEYPNPWATVSPAEEQLEEGAIWRHLGRHQITFRHFGLGASGMFIPDQLRASQFIQEIEERYAKPGVPLPRFVFIRLPHDHTASPRPKDGFPFEASFVADNDYALGRIVEYLSRSPWWKEMAIFVTEASAEGGSDHIDAQRTLLLGAGPWFKRDYVSHTNTSFPGLLKTVFELLKLPPLTLFDATASDLSDMFTDTPDFTPYQLQPIDPRLFVPEKVISPGNSE